MYIRVKPDALKLALLGKTMIKNEEIDYYFSYVNKVVYISNVALSSVIIYLKVEEINRCHKNHPNNVLIQTRHSMLFTI